MATNLAKALCGFLLLAPAPAQAAAACFAEIAFAQRIFLVVPASKTSPKAKLTVIERDKGSSGWLPETAEKRAIIGKNGVAWANSFAHLADRGEKLKVEGDGRTPAGLFSVAAPFGFGPNSLAGYVRLDSNDMFCVNDPGSPEYNRVVPKNSLPLGARGENMSAIPLYRRGLFVTYSTDREKRSGSCIFIHVWRSEHGATLGCVALAEPDVADLQARAAGGKTILAILPQRAAEDLRECIYAR